MAAANSATLAMPIPTQRPVRVGGAASGAEASGVSSGGSWKARPGSTKA